MEAGVILSALEEIEILMVSYEDNTSQDKSWIFDSGSTVHVHSQKELFNNFLVAKEKMIVDCGWLGLRGHWHWDCQDYRKR